MNLTLSSHYQSKNVQEIQGMMKYEVYYPVSYPNLRDKVQTLRNWLEPEIGEEEIDWVYVWGLNIFYFKHEEDKVKFILRWL